MTDAREPAWTPDELRVAPQLEAELTARLQRSYAQLAPAEATTVARCRDAVLAAATVQPTRRRAWHPRWWWGAAAAAGLVLVVSRPWRPDLAQREADQAFTTTPRSALPNRRLAPVGTVREDDGRVQFDLQLPAGASAVTLVGDFNGWDADATPMHARDGARRWSVAIPLEPGRHVYAFIVDGRRWIVDPLAPQVPDDGYGPANAVIVDGRP